MTNDQSRRDFLKKSALTTAGIGLGAMAFSPKSYGRILGANDRVNVGIVGFSDRARYALIPAMQVHAKEMNFEFTAVSDLWSRRRDECQAFVKEKTGLSIAACRNNDELYDRKDVDVVIISTADFQHALHCKEAVEAGRDVYVEKPFAETMADNRAAKEAVLRTGKIVQVGSQRRSGLNYHQANEFIKAGFTQEAATLVKPPMLKESKVKMECKVVEVKPLGSEGGAGNLVICEVLRMHVDESILNAEGTMIDQRKLHHIARLGGDWYCKVDESSLFHVAKPNTQLGIGIDALPETIRNSNILTGNNLGQLANVHEYPIVDATFEDERLKNIIQYFSINPDEMDQELHKYAKELLDAGKVSEAWQVLLADS